MSSYITTTTTPPPLSSSKGSPGWKQHVDNLPTLCEFVKEMAQNTDTDSVMIVAGNEAGDADSIITAITYAYFLYCYRKIPMTMSLVALIKFKREDMALRGETQNIIFQTIGIDPADLVFGDDPGTPGLLERTERVILTDHNAVDGILVPLGDKVYEIMDHHQDSQAHPWVKYGARNIAFSDEALAPTAASACTVIFEQYYKLDNLLGMALLQKDNGAVAYALMCVILIDGSNKSKINGGKLCSRDVAALQVLQEITDYDATARKTLYQQLKFAKSDPSNWDDKTAVQILRYDLKVFPSSSDPDDAGKPLYTVGISSSPVSIKALTGKEDWMDSLSERVNEYDLYLVMTKRKDDGKGKQILFTSKTERILNSAVAFFTSSNDPDLDLKEIEVSMAVPASTSMPIYYKGYNQDNTEPTRKQIAPLSIDFLDTL